mgnify:CR=1 FL=1
MHQSLMVCTGVKLCIAILLTIWSSMFMTRWGICPLRILSLLLGRLPILREWKESYPLFRQECVVRSEGETMDKNAPRFYSTVSWYGKTLHSCSPPVHRMTYEWLLKNENAIAFMLTADSRLFVCTIIGYAVFRVNGLPYAQAICLPLPCSSTSSFTKTPHKVLLHKDGVDIDKDTQ